MVGPAALVTLVQFRRRGKGRARGGGEADELRTAGQGCSTASSGSGGRSTASDGRRCTGRNARRRCKLGCLGPTRSDGPAGLRRGPAGLRRGAAGLRRGAADGGGSSDEWWWRQCAGRAGSRAFRRPLHQAARRAGAFSSRLATNCSFCRLARAVSLMLLPPADSMRPRSWRRSRASRRRISTISLVL
jgi:hypothetical protein